MGFQVLEHHFGCWLSNMSRKVSKIQNQCLPAAGEENFDVWVQNHEVRAVWGFRKWCWLTKSGVSQAYSNTWLRAGVSLCQHLAHLNVSNHVLTPFKRQNTHPECTPRRRHAARTPAAHY